MDKNDSVFIDMASKYLRQAYQLFFSGENRNDFFHYLKSDLISFLITRSRRVREIMSREVKKASRLQEALTPHRRYHATLCIDSRVSMKLLACLLSHSVKTPAGKFDTEYLPVKGSSKLALAPDGVMAKIIAKELAISDTLVEIMMVHTGCSAAEKIAQDCHGIVSDHGLFYDLEHKVRMGEAISAYVEEHYSGKRVLVFYICFNPENGHSYYGLHHYLNDPEVKQEGFTQVILDRLVREGGIIYTEELAKNKTILKELSKYYFPCNYREQYAQSTLSFWRNMTNIVPAVVELFETKIQLLSQFSNQDDLRQVSVLLIASMYSGFLHNYLGDVIYPYGTHTECCVTVTTDGKGPYPNGIVAFSLDTNSPRLPEYISFGRELILKNRKEGRVNGYHNGLSRAPVLTFLFRRTKQQVSPEEVRKIRETDWSDLVDIDWYKMTEEQFYCYLIKKVPGLSLGSSQTINKLRILAQKLYTPGEASTEHFLTGRMIPIWILADQNRNIIKTFPFLMNGY